MTRIINLMLSLAVALFFQGCSRAEADVAPPCEYSYVSVSRLIIGTVDLSDNPTLSDYSRVLDMLSYRRPLTVVVDLNLMARSIESDAVCIESLDYKLVIDGIGFASGRLQPDLVIEPESAASLPVPLTFDISSLLDGSEGKEVLTAMKNFLGMRSEWAEASLYITPSVKVGNYEVPAKETEVSFSFHGRCVKR